MVSVNIPIDKLVLSPFNIRAEMGFGDEEDEELVENVKSEGVKDELIVRPVGDVYEVVRGRRRFLSAKQSGVVKEVPCIVREMTDEEALDNSLMEVIFRKDVDPVSLGKAIKKRLEMSGKSLRWYAEKTKKSPSTLSEWIRMNDLAEDLQKLVSEGSVSFRDALKVARLDLPREKQEDLARKATEEGAEEFRKTLERMRAEQEKRGAPKGLLIIRVSFGMDSKIYDTLKRLAEEKGLELGDYAKSILEEHVAALRRR